MPYKTGVGVMVILCSYVLRMRKPIISTNVPSHINIASQSAVVRGAAIRGLEGIAPRVKHARRHYGINLLFPFREGIDPEDTVCTTEWDNLKRCRDRMSWLISKVSFDILFSVLTN